MMTRHAAIESCATEVVSATDASVLGRCLVTLGVPAGEKAGLDQFPPVVWDVPSDVQRSFTRIYVDHRENRYANKQTMTIQEERSQTYLWGLQELLTAVTGERVTLGHRTVTISAGAARALDAT